jgi:cyclopropane fatty-acyl-phospholipid synthase-like methyltransferase
VDISARAIELAQAKAAARNLEVAFSVADARRLEDLGQRFDTVLDCGLFHVFDDPDRAAFVESLTSVVARGGRYHMLCFSDRQCGDWGPRRITEAEIRDSFSEGWAIGSLEHGVIDLTINPDGAKAWKLAAIRC